LPVAQASSTTHLDASPSQSTYGQEVTFSASVTSQFGGPATGTVQFFRGSTLLGVATLDNGVATFATSALQTGVNGITAVYLGDANVSSSTSNTVSYTVGQATSTTELVASPSPSIFGQSVTFTATVTSQFGGPVTGSVQFFDGSTLIGTGTLTNGVAEINTSALTAGPHSITAHYLGDENAAASTSGVTTQQVAQASSTTVLQAAPSSSSFGQSVDLTATVTSQFGGPVTGSVQFFDGATLLGTVAIIGGVALLPISSLAAGTHQLSAVFQGDSNVTTSTSSALSYTVAQASSMTELTTSSSSTTYGQSVTLTAGVSSQFGGPVTGTVEFYAGETLIGTAPIVDGVAQLNTTAIPAGTNSITAHYLGNSNVQASTSNAVTQTVSQATTTTSLVAVPTNPAFGQTVTLTATVSPQFTGVPTGTVQFFDGLTQIGTASINESGQAILNISSLATGSHSITAVFSADSNFTASTSPAVTVTISQSETIGGGITSSTPQSFFGQDVTLTAFFSATSSSGAPFQGTVTFYVGDQVLGTVDITAVNLALSIRRTGGVVSILDGQTTVYGQAVITTNALPVGQNTVTAVYSGDSNYSSAVTEQPVSVEVEQAQTKTTLGLITTATETVLTASVIVTTPGDPPLTGSIAFYDGTTLLATVPVVNGSASYTLGALSPGLHTFSAVYVGDASVSSSAVTETVNTSGPQVTGLSRFGVHASPTVLSLKFDSSLDAASAQNTANYIITDSRGRRISVTSAHYDAATMTVTLRPSRRLSLYQTYTLTVVGQGATPVRGISGIPLDGSGQGQPGTNFVAKITWKALAVPGRAPALRFAAGHPTNVFRGTLQAYLRLLKKLAPLNGRR
jgi:hypothetical protein